MARRFSGAIARGVILALSVAAMGVLTPPRGASGALDYTLKKDFTNTGPGGQSGRATAGGGAHVLVGVPGQSRVYVYDRLDPSTPPSPVQTIISPNASAGDNFGAALAPIGDTDLLVGAPGEDTVEGGVDAGAAYL